jgi:arsenate reductase (thioredoxin)
MVAKVHNVLFLCTGNTARSVLAEAILNSPEVGQGRFKAYSAGSFPKGEVNPFTLALLRSKGLATEGLRSKSWDEFTEPGAPAIDFVVTVCDNAAGEVCPIWPGHPLKAHWGVADPAAVEGTCEERLRAFAIVEAQLRERIEKLVRLPLGELDDTTAKQRPCILELSDLW